MATISKKKLSRYNKCTSENFRKQFTCIRVLGSEGKDGLTFEVQRNSDGVKCALKVFKPRKSLTVIKKEYDFQQKAAQIGWHSYTINSIVFIYLTKPCS